jgi:hypothetical protein
MLSMVWMGQRDPGVATWWTSRDPSVDDTRLAGDDHRDGLSTDRRIRFRGAPVIRTKRSAVHIGDSLTIHGLSAFQGAGRQSA